jgi:hypothetical protein
MTPDVITNFSLLSWGSIFAGTVIALMIQFTLSLLGVAIGFVTIHPRQEQVPVKTLTTGAIIWWIVTSLISMYYGAWVAARLANVAVDAARLHGMITWATTMIVTFFIFTTGAGFLATGAMGFIASAIKAAGGVLAGTSALGTMGAGAPGLGGAAAMRPEMMNQIFPQLSGQLQSINNRIKKYMDNQEAKQEIANTAGNIIRKGPQNINEADKEQFQHVLTKYTDMPQEEARTKVDQLITQATTVTQQVQQSVERTKMVATEVAEETAKAVSAAAFASFVMMVLTFIVSVWGGAAGAIIHP